MIRRILQSLVTISLLGAFFTLPVCGMDCWEGQQPSGARFLVCLPDSGQWNGDLVLFAHGFVSPKEPVGIPYNQLLLPDGTKIPELVTSLGYAFATTSYRTNGLAVVDGIQDLVQLTFLFQGAFHKTRHVLLVGASEGGLITALALEQHPTVFSGGMSLCGPIGDFRGQINHFGDFRVVFDYFFPNVLPPSPVSIPETVETQWNAQYLPAILGAIQSNPSRTQQLLKVTKAPVDASDPNSIAETISGSLWYNLFATNDAHLKLGGQPFDNSRRLYLGSSNDFLLNWRVFRTTADPAALAEIAAHYQTTGKLQVPLVSLHTTGDPIVPYWHAPMYRLKAIGAGSGLLFSNLPIVRYGHVNFKSSEALAGFALLVLKVTGMELLNAPQALKDPAALNQFQTLARQAGAMR